MFSKNCYNKLNELSFTYNLDHVLMYIMCKCHASATCHWFVFSPEKAGFQNADFCPSLPLKASPSASHELYTLWQMPHLGSFLMMINERPHALWAYSFGNSVGKRIYSNGRRSIPCVNRVLPVTFFRGLPQGFSFNLWLGSSFGIINYRILYMLVTFGIATLYTNRFLLTLAPGVGCLLSVWQQFFKYTMAGTCFYYQDGS